MRSHQVKSELRKLERRLDCRAYAPMDKSEVRRCIVRPKESVLLYDPAPLLSPKLGWSGLIALYAQRVQCQYGSESEWKLRRGRTSSKHKPLEMAILHELRLFQSMLGELGPFPTYYEAKQRIQLVQKLIAHRQLAADGQLVEFLETEVAGHLAYILENDLLPPLTPKVRTLLSKLREYSNKPEFRGIVFVEKRYFLSSPGPLHTKPILWLQVGSHSASWFATETEKRNEGT